MQLKDSQASYGLVSIINHWATAALVVLALGIGLILEDLARGDLKSNVVMVHMTAGLLVLALGLLRLGWRTTQPRPEPAGQPAGWEQRAARLGHGALALMILLMPLSGILMQIGEGHAVGMFGLVLIEGSGREIEVLEQVGHVIHGFGGNLLIGLIALHVLAAIKHHVFDRDATLVRMLGRARQPEAVPGT